MADTTVVELPTAIPPLPVVTADPGEVARIEDTINIKDRAGISVYGDGAQQAVTDFSDKILSEVRNKDMGEAGKLLTDILLKAKNLDPASLKDKGWLGGLFGSLEARVTRFKEEFSDVASQIDRIGLQLDQHKDTLRRDIAILDDLHEQTKGSILKLDAYVQAGKDYVTKFRNEELPRLKATAESATGSASGGTLEAQAYQDALQALDRLEKRVYYLQQARQLGIQQLPQIRIVQAGDETLIENLQATSSLTVPAWKQKMVILLGLTQQQSALELQKTVTDATNKMIKQASQMMKDQAVDIEEQAQRGIVDIETLAQANRDLIDTVTSVLRVQEEGRKKRADAEAQMQQMTVDLKKALTPELMPVANALRILVLLLAAVTLASCDKPGGGRPFEIVSGSENTVLEPIVREFCDQKGFACTFKYEGSLDIGLALGGSSGIDADAVWPASSVWVDLFDTGRRVKDATSIAQMPVILGVKKSKAEALGWVGKDVYMKDILAAVEGGQLKFLMTSATQSNSGASAYLAMLSSALGGKAVIEPGDLEQPEVRDTVKALLKGVERSSGSSGWLADLYVKSAQDGTQYDAMWNYEATLKETNDRLKPLGDEPLYAIYPADGVAIGDSPLGFVDRSKGAEYETFFNDLVAYMQTAAVEQRIADTGRRIPLGGNIAAKPEPDWNFDPVKLVTAIRMPEPAVIRQALDLYQSALRKPSLTALCLDYSGSMSGDGERQLEQAMGFLLTPEEASKVLVQWSPEDKILVIPFDSNVRDHFSATGKPEDQAALLAQVDAESADGGTDMYACASDALSQIAATPDLDNYLPAIVIMTDGRSDGGSSQFLREWSQVTPRIPVFGITFGDADKTQLASLADATSARVFDGAADLAGAFRAVRGYN